VATQESWNTRDRILLVFTDLERCLDRYRSRFLKLEAIKTGILDDPIKKADLKLLFDQDPKISMIEVVSKYQKAKQVYDWLVLNT
jgi:hypothetical protein